MANKFYFRSQYEDSNAKSRARLLLKVSIGAAGAPTIVANTGMGVASITRNSAGDYSIALNRAYNRLLGLSVISNSGASAPAAPLINLRTDSVNSSSAPLVRFTCRDIAAAPADPANGEILLIEIKLMDSPLPY